MSDGRVKMLESCIQNAIDYNRQENDVSYAETLGVLELIKARIIREALEEEEEDDDADSEAQF